MQDDHGEGVQNEYGRVRRPRETRPYLRPLPLRERAGVRGSKCRSCPSVPYPRGVLPGEMKSEILRFAQNDNERGRMTTGRAL